jgi:hypothetical protein
MLTAREPDLLNNRFSRVLRTIRTIRITNRTEGIFSGIFSRIIRMNCRTVWIFSRVKR